MSSARRYTEGLLFTDFYQLTMAQLYFRHGLADRRVQFDYFFRSHPHYGEHSAGYSIFAGLEWLLDWMRETRATADDVAYLRSLTGASGERLFDDDFLEWFGANGTMEGLTIRAVPEGRVVHPNVPLVVVDGPLAMAQLIETPVLNHLNYQTLVATKASRIREAAQGAPILEFGMRRAHEMGANAGTRAALIGGADFSSNVGVSRLMGVQPKGTHAHSMVQAFLALGGSELDAFRAFAELYPDDCVLLVDTIDTLASGVPNAIRVFEELRARGHVPLGIRLDSGDLAYLAIQAAIQLDAAGFDEVSIVLSNNLDELVIWQIVTQIREEAPKYGVDAEKLLAPIGSRCRHGADHFHGRLGTGRRLQARGHRRRGRAAAGDQALRVQGQDPQPGRQEGVAGLRPARQSHRRSHRPGPRDNPRPVNPDPVPSDRRNRGVVGSKRTRSVRSRPCTKRSLPTVGVSVTPLIWKPCATRRVADLERLDPGVKRLMNPHLYHVSLSRELWDHKHDLVARLRSKIR